MTKQETESQTHNRLIDRQNTVAYRTIGLLCSFCRPLQELMDPNKWRRRFCFRHLDTLAPRRMGFPGTISVKLCTKIKGWLRYKMTKKYCRKSKKGACWLRMIYFYRCHNLFNFDPLIHHFSENRMMMMMMMMIKLPISTCAEQPEAYSSVYSTKFSLPHEQEHRSWAIIIFSACTSHTQLYQTRFLTI